MDVYHGLITNSLQKQVANMSDSQREKSNELKMFLFIVVFLFPFLSVALVGGYGFAIWISQMLFG